MNINLTTALVLASALGVGYYYGKRKVLKEHEQKIDDIKKNIFQYLQLNEIMTDPNEADTIVQSLVN